MTKCAARNCRKLLLLAAGWAALAGPMVIAQASAAPNAKPLAFDVVSIRPNKIDGPFEIHYTPDRFVAVNAPLQALLRNAYGDTANRTTGLPNWAGSERYDIDAKVANSDIATYQKLTPEQRSVMIQTLLADRFKLKVHFETKEIPEYALVVAKNGPKLNEAKPGDVYSNGVKDPNGNPTGSGMFWNMRAPAIGQSVSMEELTRTLGGPQSGHVIDRPVVDKTGLTGRYDFTLVFARETMGGASPSEDAGPSIFTALQEQLGLKLEPAKGTVETLVIDHIERPSEN